MEVVLLQMGKVASTAIGTALRKQRIEAVQAHIATAERLSRKLNTMTGPSVSEPVAEQVYQDFHQELRATYLLARRRVAPQAYEIPLPVISPVRDPLTWYWSHFAQMYVHYQPQLLKYHLAHGGSEDAFKPEDTLLVVQRQMFDYLAETDLPLDRPQRMPRLQKMARKLDPSAMLPAQVNRFLVPLRWFEEDFQPATGINVYDHPFDTEAAWGQIQVDGFRVLLLRYEQLADLQRQIGDFVGKPRLKLTRENTSAGKDIPFDLKWIAEEGRALMPTRLVERIYSSTYATHFGYTPD